MRVGRLGVVFALAVVLAGGPFGGTVSAQEAPGAGVQVIGGGQSAQVYPWMASFQLDGSTHYCGASLIHPQWVITARHCADGISDLTKLRLRIGSLQSNSGGTVTSVDRVYIAPGDTVGHDLALLHLPAPVPNKPIRLAADAGPAGTATRIIGWGQRCAVALCETPPVNLHEADTVLSDDSACSLGGIVAASELCVGQWFGGKSACYYDSGGPAVRRVGDEWQLTGLTSRSALLLIPICGLAPGIYTDATTFRTFISETIGTPL